MIAIVTDINKNRKFFGVADNITNKINDLKSEMLVKRIFEAMKMNKLLEQAERTNAELDVEKPLVKELEKRQSALNKAMLHKLRQNSIRAIAKQLNSQLWSYFARWKEYNNFYKDRLHDVKLLLLGIYRQKLSTGLRRWKNNVDKGHRDNVIKANEDLTHEGDLMEAQMSSLDDAIKKYSEREEKYKLTKIQRNLNLLRRRIERIYFKRWKNGTNTLGLIEDATLKLSKRLSRRSLRNGFNKYNQKTKELRRLDHIKEKIAYHLESVNERINAKTFKNWVDFKNRSKMAKEYFLRALARLNNIEKAKAYKAWLDFMNMERHKDLKTLHENFTAEQGDLKNNMDNISKKIEKKQDENDETAQKMNEQARRRVANFFSRFFHLNLSKGFYTWKNNLVQEKEKKKFLKDLILHWMRYKEFRAFKQWLKVHNENKIEELQKNVERGLNTQNELLIQSEHQQAAFDNQINDLKEDLADQSFKKNEESVRLDKAIKSLANQATNQVRSNKEQSMLNKWRTRMNRENQAANKLMASLKRFGLVTGFVGLKQESRQNTMQFVVDKTLFKFGNKFKNLLMRRALSRWRTKLYENTLIQLEGQRLEHALNLDQSTAHKLATKDFVRSRGERAVKKNNIKKVFQGWADVITGFKFLRRRKQIISENVQTIRARIAIQKWRERNQATNELRIANENAIETFKHNLSRRCMEYWLFLSETEKAFCDKLAKLANRFDRLGLSHAFQQINHFKISASERNLVKKKNGSDVLAKTLDKLFKSRINRGFYRIKSGGYEKQKEVSLKKGIFLRALRRRMRLYFNFWKHKNEQIAIKESINEEGDVAFKHNLLARNVEVLKDLIAKEGYSKDKMNDFIRESNDKQKNLMRGFVNKLALNSQKADYFKKAFNQWKAWINLRKSVRYYADFVQKRLANAKLHKAFKRWQHSDDVKRVPLQILEKSQLIDKAVHHGRELQAVHHQKAKKDEKLKNLKNQRDVLLGQVVKSQKVALSVWKNNYDEAKANAFRKWIELSDKMKLDEYEMHLQKALRMVAEMHNQYLQIEDINKGLLIENEDLRQASLDGIEIAQAVEELTMEREQLSVDLANRSLTVKKLVEENNNLAIRLEQAQFEAENLVNLTTASSDLRGSRSTMIDPLNSQHEKFRESAFSAFREGGMLSSLKEGEEGVSFADEIPSFAFEGGLDEPSHEYTIREHKKESMTKKTSQLFY